MNRQIEKARKAALDVLKPSKRELEHGLELHRNSLVVESYGFAPRAPRDWKALAKQIAAGASPREVQELQEDMSSVSMTYDAAALREFKEAWDASGVTCIFQNAAEEGDEIPVLLKRLGCFTYVGQMLRDYSPCAYTPDEIVEAKKQKRHCFYLSSNGVPLPQEWNTVEDELRQIRTFFQLGVRMMHLTYNRANKIGAGCGEANDAGLTDFGRRVVAEMNRVGVIVDIAHSGFQTSLDAAKVSTRPMVASHSVAHALSGHYRGKPDNVIRAIADTDGFIGICAIPRFLSGSCGIQAWLDHAEYIAKKFGADRVAIGMDTSYAPINKPPHNSTGWPKMRAPWRSLWPEPGASNPKNCDQRQQLSLAWTNWPLFTVGLVQRGFSDKDIANILGGNVMRVIRANWNKRQQPIVG